MDWFVFFKKATDLVPPLTKAQSIFISANPIGSQMANQKTRRRSKLFKGLSIDDGRSKLAEIAAPLP
jgi:hypothetical protein